MIKNLLRTILKNPVLANIMMLMILVAGYLSAQMMSRETFPRFSLDVIVINVAYPGADPEEIEEGICLRLEEALDGVEGVKEMYSEASEGIGTVTLELRENANLMQVKDEVKTLVDGINNFPEKAERPIVQEVKFRGEVMAVMLWGKLPERQLKEIARRLKDEIISIPGVTQASISGIRDYQISIEISEEKLRKYNLTFKDISAAVARNGLNVPAGTIRTGDEEFRIRVLGRRYQAKEYKNIPVITRADGTIITLGQIANIRDTFDEDARIYSYFNGYPAVSINIYKTEDEDALKIAGLVNQFIEKKQQTLPKNLHITKFRDVSRLIQSRLDMLISNGQLGLILVFLSLWLFLDMRLSFWVTMGIPISLAGAMIILAVCNCSINMLSLFGLIMVLGLIVDDAIVVGESVYEYRYGQNYPPLKAAVAGTSEVALPVIAAVLTTVVAFVPLFLIPGVMGKFIMEIPIPVVAALSVSLLECLFILPVHLRHLPVKTGKLLPGVLGWPGRFKQKIANGMDYFINNLYGPFVDLALHWRYVALCIAVIVLFIVGGLVKGGVIKFKFMEKTDNDFMVAKVEMAPGTPLTEVQAAAKQVMNGWNKVASKYSSRIPQGENLTVGVYSLVGGTIQFGESGGGSSFFEVNIELLPSEKRNIFYRELLDEWKQSVGVIPGAEATNFQSRGGGPGGLPVEIELRGDSIDELLQASDMILEKLRTYEGVFDEQTDYRAGKREFIIKIKPQAYHLGLSLDTIAEQIQSGFYGSEALSIQRERDDIKVKVRYPEKSGRDSIEYFKKMRIVTSNGARVPLRTVATISLREGQSSIKRIARNRKVLVQADVSDNVNATEIMRDLLDNFMPQVLEKYDVTYSTRGHQQETRESLGSLFVWFPVAMFGIYLIIASMFRSYIQPVVIMTTIPFGLIGGVIGHLLFGKILSIMSLFGMVALAGIVVNDAIVLIEGVNLRLENGMPFFEALVEGGKRRFRAIMLTTLTTFSGLMPLILERSMQAQFLIPMAISIAFGVLFATILTLVFIPCLLAILNDLRRIKHYLWHLEMPTREQVEPRAEINLKEFNQLEDID